MIANHQNQVIKQIVIEKLEIRGKLCVLRPIQEIDSADATSLLKNDEVTKNLYWGGPKTLKHIQNLYKAYVWARSRGKNHHLAIRLIENDKFVGSIGLRMNRNPKNPELGYWLGEQYWGKGIGTEAVRLCTYLAFEHLFCENLVATTFYNNKASQKILIKSGFEKKYEYPYMVNNRNKYYLETCYQLSNYRYFENSDYFQPNYEEIVLSFM
jgi:[ribosomal protein S5]-alanine N-acetyltransferase